MRDDSARDTEPRKCGALNVTVRPSVGRPKSSEYGPRYETPPPPPLFFAVSAAALIMCSKV